MISIATSDEIQAITNRLSKIYGSKKYKIYSEKPLEPDSPYRTTLIIRRNYETPILIEVQTKLYYHLGLKDLINYNIRNRKNCEVYIALDSNSTLPSAEQLAKVKKDGVGLTILGEDNNIEIMNKAKNFSLIVTPDPNLNFGKYSTQVKDSINKFNEIDRKDGLRDLCEVFESVIEELGIKLIKKDKFLSLNESGFKAKNLSDRINILATDNAYKSKRAIIDEILKIDLHSFRNGRNLCDHKTKTKKEEYRRQIQFPDKMMLGCRLIHELRKIIQRIR